MTPEEEEEVIKYLSRNMEEKAYLRTKEHQYTKEEVRELREERETKFFFETLPVGRSQKLKGQK